MVLKKHNRHPLLISACVSILIYVYGASFTLAQVKPTEFDSRSDDKQLCSSGKGNPLKDTEYCDFWRTYSDNRTDAGGTLKAKDARNELIKYVQGRVDRFYEERTNKKRFNRALLQTILEVLEIGAVTTIGIINGERAKDVLAIALTGFQANRTTLNKNFDLLQTRIIVNKMRKTAHKF